MTEARFYEPARLSAPPKLLFSLKPLDATTWLRSLLSNKVFRILGGRKLPVYFRIAGRYLRFYDRGRMGSVKIAILSPHFQFLLFFVVLTWRSEASKNIRAPEERRLRDRLSMNGNGIGTGTSRSYASYRNVDRKGFFVH